MNTKEIIEKISYGIDVTKDEYIYLFDNYTELDVKFARDKACIVRDNVYGNKVYIRGLIEFTNICKNNCYYCGLRCSNNNINRYRLTIEEILECCEKGYELGFHTFVLQGGEDSHFTVDMLCEIVSTIKSRFTGCAVTLSIGEKDYDTYKKIFDAGTDRYLLRHETANEEHYNKMHPSDMSLHNRKKCLYELKDIGYQVGAGFMVGSPYQSSKTLADDMIFLKELEPDMVGIGPFIAHKDTPFRNEDNGSVNKTLFLLSITRLLLPNVLLPATTALATLDNEGMKKGILSGANVVMPNLSPIDACKKYELYNNKKFIGTESANSLSILSKQLNDIGFEIDFSRGDAITKQCPIS